MPKTMKNTDITAILNAYSCHFCISSQAEVEQKTKHMKQKEPYHPHTILNSSQALTIKHDMSGPADERERGPIRPRYYTDGLTHRFVREHFHSHACISAHKHV